MKFILLFLFFSLTFSFYAHARPEFAVRHGVVNCSACHNSPFGGASKNVNGKLFFTRHKPMGEAVPPEYYSIDLRANALYPKNPQFNNNGFAIMSTIGSVHIPVSTGKENFNTKLVADYDFGMLGPTLRNAYALIENNPREPNLWLKHILIGRFNIPFGLMTDEHWDLLRLQTKTTINDFDAGVGFSGDPFQAIHYDFLITTSNTTSSTSGRFTTGTTASPESKHAFWLNLRSDLQPLPMYIGASGMVHSLYSTPRHPWAASVYSAFSFHRISGIAPATLLFEAALADGWTNSTYGLISNFTPAGDYLTSVEDKKSLGIKAELQIEFWPQVLTATYKIERVNLDVNYGADAFMKHNVGLKWYITANMNLLFRAESGYTTFTAVPKDSTRATKDYYYAIFHYGL